MAKLQTPTIRFVLREEPAPYGFPKKLTQPEEIEEYYRQVIATDVNFESNKEHVIVVALNSRLEIIGYNVVSVGTVNEATAHPREIFRPLVAAGAYGFVLIHNHPSSDPSPSMADTALTRKIVAAADIMLIKFLDHVIMGEKGPGRESYYSFREAGIVQ